jgi:hypothetical protein
MTNPKGAEPLPRRRIEYANEFRKIKTRQILEILSYTEQL